MAFGAHNHDLRGVQGHLLLDYAALLPGAARFAVLCRYIYALNEYFICGGHCVQYFSGFPAILPGYNLDGIALFQF